MRRSTLRTYAPLTAAACAILVQIASECSGGWLGRSARGSPAFSAYEFVIGVLVVLTCAEFANHDLWKLQAPGELLQVMRTIGRKARLDEAIRAAETGLTESVALFQTDLEQARMNTSVVLNVVYSAARRVLDNSRRQTLGRLGICIASLVILLTFAAYFGTAHYGDSVAFSHLSRADGFVRHLYFVTTTLTTIGYGDISAANMFGYVFVIVCACVTVFIFTLSVGFVVSHWYYRISRLDQDLKSEIGEIVGRLSVPHILIRFWL